ncbi:hypothetical protein [Methylotuvimicrobium sp. KM2]|uniref:hypothetical protein n=1 Tax=Methylotuvimicrobium sp. KM2 TaxID=3133976 RepID=UPI00310132CC
MNKINPQIIAEKLRHEMYFSPLIGSWHMRYKPNSSALDIDRWFLKGIRSPAPGEFSPVHPEYARREIIRAMERAGADLNITDINRLEKLLRLYLLPDERCLKGRKQPTNNLKKKV